MTPTGVPRLGRSRLYWISTMSRFPSAGADAQPEKRRRRHPAESAGGDHRRQRVGQKLAGLRHALRRGPAAVHPKPLDLRAAILRPDGAARRRSHRRPRSRRSPSTSGRQPNPRSTVATITEIYDYLRLLFARVGDVGLPAMRHADRAADARRDRTDDSRPAGTFAA